MIKNFACKYTKQIFLGVVCKKLPINIQNRALVKLRQLDVANNIEDLKIPPSNFLEKLKGSRKNQHSIRINKQWSVCFEWHNNNAINVEIVDYH
jgi:proteic killer suppression protein